MPRVLIVDDHAFIRRGVQTILHSFPEWEFCGEAENGKEAIRLARRAETGSDHHGRLHARTERYRGHPSHSKGAA